MLAVSLMITAATLFATGVIAVSLGKAWSRVGSLSAQLARVPLSRDLRYTVSELRMPPPFCGQVHVLPVRRANPRPLLPADLRAAA